MSTEQRPISEMQEVSIGPVSVEIPKDWSLVPLDEITENSGQYGANASAEEYDPSEFRYVRITDISEDGQLKDDEKRSIPVDGNEKYRLNEGDLLFARTGAVGRSYLYSEEDSEIPCAFAGYLIRYELSDEVCSEYINQFTKSRYFQKWIDSIARSTTHANINASEYASLKIPYPPLPEQHRIADILSTVDKQIQQSDRIIEKTEELRSGLLQDLFSNLPNSNKQKTAHLGPFNLEIPENWDLVRLDELNKDDYPICYGVVKPGEYSDDGVPLLNIEDVTETGEIIYDTIHKISKDLHNQYSRSQLSGGEVLVSVKGTVGNVVHLEDEIGEANISRDLARITPTDQLDARWLRYCLLTKPYQDLINILSTGSTRASLNIGALREVHVVCPPMSEQRRISAVLDSSEERIENEYKRKERLQELKRGLMQDLLTGKVRVDPE